VTEVASERGFISFQLVMFQNFSKADPGSWTTHRCRLYQLSVASVGILKHSKHREQMNTMTQITK